MSQSDSDIQQSQMEMPEVAQPAEKVFYSTGEVSEKTGVEPYVLRYWETEFKILHPSKRAGHRCYQQKDIDTILLIKKLLYEDLYTIAGAKKKLREAKEAKDRGEELPGISQASVSLESSQVVSKDSQAQEILREIQKELEEWRAELQ